MMRDLMRKLPTILLAFSLVAVMGMSTYGTGTDLSPYL
jgi:hypothetical protein